MKNHACLLLIFSCGTAITLPRSAFAQVNVPSVLVKLMDHVEVPAREAGVLTTVAVTEGSSVNDHDVLAGIDDKEAQFAKQRAELELQIARKNAESELQVRSAEKTLAVAKDELARAQSSVDKIKKSISQTELDRLLLAVDQGGLLLDKAKQDLAVATLTKQLKEVELQVASRHLERRQIMAPFRGVVVQVHRQRGEWVEPGEKLLRLVRLDRLRAEGYVSSRESAAIAAGQRVTLRVVLPNQTVATFAGKLTFVSPEIDPVNSQVRILAEIDNPSLELRPGLKGSLVIGNAPDSAAK